MSTKADARPLVGHGEGDDVTFRIFTQGYGDDASSGVFQCIFQEVRQCLCEKMPVSPYPNPVLDPGLEAESGFFRGGLVEFTGVFDQCTQLYFDHLFVGTSSLDLRDMQQRVECVENLVQFFA